MQKEEFISIRYALSIGSRAYDKKLATASFSLYYISNNVNVYAKG
jgi:hypothetical protein